MHAYCTLSPSERGPPRYSSQALPKKMTAGAPLTPIASKPPRAGMSVQAYAQKHKHDSGLTGEEARFAVTAKKVAKKRKAKR